MASFVHRKRSFREINIRPSKREQFSDTQTRIKTNHDPDEFPLLIRQRRLLYLLLFGKRKTRYFFLFRFRSSDFVCRVLFQLSERIRKFQRVLNNRNNPVYGISHQSLSGCQIARLHKFGDILLYDYGRQFLKLVLAQFYLQVLFDNLRISFARFRFRRRLYVVRKPYVQPFNARKKSGLSQEDVAEKLGVSRQTISKWETDETLPDIQQAKRLALLYNLSLDELISFDMDVKELEEAIKNTSEEVQNKIDWTTLWSKKYPILAVYQKEVETNFYAKELERLLSDLEKRYGYTRLNSLLVLKDILSHTWNKK